MKRSEIQAFIRLGVEEMAPQVTFGYGRLTEWNSKRSNDYPGTWLETVPMNTVLNNSLPNDSWPIRLHIGKLDAHDSSPEQYELLINECDELAQKLIKQYNDELEDAVNVTISDISREPFIKKHADCVTGVILAFTLTVIDKTNLC